MELEKKIAKIVQEALLNRATSLDLEKVLSECKTDLEQYKWNTASRLVKYLERFKDLELTREDFLVSLRNYLLLFQESVILSNELIFPEAETFGIKKDIDCSYYCCMNMPRYMQEVITEQAFMRGKENKQKKDYFLGVSPYIYSLTGFKYFKSIEQKLAVNGALNTPAGYTTLVSLPTGGGKSLITQSIAYQEKKGLTIVIVPTVSLIMDQVRAAKKNIKHDAENEIFGYESGIGDEEREKLFASLEQETMRLLFISPEALIKNKKFCTKLEEANEKKYIKNIVIDEAHIVMDWGDFFRVDYQCLEPWRKKLVQSNVSIRTILLSATFVKDTVAGLKSMFTNGDKWIEIRCDKLRREPRFQVVKAESYSDKNRKVIELMRYLPRPMVVYVSSPDKAEEIGRLAEQNGFTNFELFTGKTESEERRRIIKAWADNEMDMMIATSAFGVGVDKSDVRTVLHLYIPENPNAYYQELGRGGRDGLPCLSVMLTYTQEDLSATFKKLGKVLSPEKILGRWETMLNSPNTHWYKDIYTIDTSVKPNYNSSDEYAEDASKRDIQWNIYVLLLLRRYNLIEIVDLVLDDKNKYLFLIRIIEDKIFQCNEETRRIITEIRDKEWNGSESEYKKMKSAIHNSEHICLSEMFFKTYACVDEYCGGCNEHSYVVASHRDEFPNLKKITHPIKRVNPKLNSIFANLNEVMILQELFGDNAQIEPIVELIEKGIDLLILDKGMEEQYLDILLELKGNCEVKIMGLNEFAKLIRKRAYYYLSASAVVLYDEDEEHLYKKIKLMQKAESACGLKVIHILREDILLGDAQKKVSDVIDGHILGNYLVGRV